MNIKRAKQEIETTVQAYLAKNSAGLYRIPAIRQRPLLLMGPPGIGKTQIMEQIASECGIGLVAYTITHHTRQSAVGLPFIRQRKFDGVERSVTEYTMSEIIASVYQKMEDTGCREGILFIDEINCVSETLAPTMLQFLQGKTFGNQPVPPGWIIVAAGNPPEYNKSVREFDVVTLDRVRRLDVEPELSVWQEYARARRLHPAILAYLELRPNDFYRIQNDVDGPQFVTARGWEDLSAFLQACETLSLPADEAVMGEYLRCPDIARDFAAYWALYKKYRADYGVDKILAGQFGDDAVARAIAAPFDERISLVSLILSGLNVRFAAARRTDAVTDDCYQALRAFKRALGDGEDAPAPDARALWEAQCRESEARLADAQKAAPSPDDAEPHARAASLLREWAGRIPDGGCAEDAFNAVRAGFNQQVRLREDAVAAAGDALEHAFDFLERAFLENDGSQELVVFVNELALGPDSSLWLAENECERFTHYSETLLLHAGADALSEELARNALRQSEHNVGF